MQCPALDSMQHTPIETVPQQRVLCIAYFFVPAGGAGVQRPLKFAKYLPHFGWQTHILTVRNGCYFATDPSLAAEVPKSCTVSRTTSWEVERLGVLRALRQRESAPGPQPGRPHAARGLARQLIPAAGNTTWGLRGWQAFAKLLGRARQSLLPDPQVGWVPFALWQALKICRTTHIDAILTTSSPYSAHLVGLLLKQCLRLPWIADFRDAWSDDPMHMLAHHRVHAALEAQVLRAADHVVGVTPGIVDFLRSRSPTVEPPGYHVITNGYDAADFQAVGDAGVTAGPPKSAADAPTFQITMTGSLYGLMTAVPLYRGMQEFLDQVPEARRKLRLSWVGQMDRRAAAEAHAAAQAYNLTDLIEHVGYVPHSTSIAWLLRSDVLLLILYPGPGAPQIMTGKVFEYLAAKRPILALAAGTAAGHLIADTQAGHVVHPHDVKAISSALNALWQQRGKPLPATPAHQAALERFERRALAQRLAAVLDTAVAAADPRNSLFLFSNPKART